MAMQEASTVGTETRSLQEGPRFLPDGVYRQLIIIKGRSGPLLRDYDKGVMRNLEWMDHGPDDFGSIVRGHQNTDSTIKVLGIYEEIRKRCVVVVDGVDTEFHEATPKYKNIWVGEHVKLLTPEEAAETHYGGRTALDWASQGGPKPKMVVRANDGYFYPANVNDVVISTPVDR